MGMVVFCHDQTPRCILVETMNNSRAFAPALLRELLAVMEESIHDRSGPVPCGRMNHHSGRLVNHQDVRVFVQNIQRQILRFGFNGLRGRLLHPQLLAAPDDRSGLGTNLLLHLHKTSSDPVLDL